LPRRFCATPAFACVFLLVAILASPILNCLFEVP